MTDKGMEDRENLFEINQNIGYCKDSREKLIREINEVNKQFKNKSISKKDYDNFFSQRLDGKTRLEWIDFCNKYTREKEGLIEEEKSNIEEFGKNIRLCRKSKEEIIREIRELNRDYEKKAISKEEYHSFLNERVDGKTRLEWIDFCNRHIEEEREIVNNYGEEAREKIYYNVKPFLPIAAVILLVVLALFLPLKPTGFITITNQFNYTDNISLVVENDYNYTWLIGDYGALSSVRLDGSISKEGSAKVYLEGNNKLYLIFDSSKLGKEGIGKITSLVVSNQGSLYNENEEDISLVNEGEQINNNSLDKLNNGNKSLNNNSIINNKKIIITASGGGSKSVKELFELKVDSIFNWNVDYNKLCTKWDVNSAGMCYGSSECCALIGLEPLGEWNSSLYLSYGRYNSGLQNSVKAQVIYANYSLDISEPYSDIVYSDVVERLAEFYYGLIRFEDVCVESCLLPGLNSTSYKLVLIVENATFGIDKIRYSVTEEINVSENAPLLAREIENMTLYKNWFMELNLSSYFYDEDGDSLSYSAYEADNINTVIKHDSALLVPERNFTGKRYMYFTASDGYYRTLR